MTNSNRKGKTGERELANELKARGFTARRGQQFSGANGDADVVGLPGIHIECKRYKTITAGDLDTFMEQAKNDTPPAQLPAVFWRADRQKWRVTMTAAAFVSLVNHWPAGNPLAEWLDDEKVTLSLDDFIAIYKARKPRWPR